MPGGTWSADHTSYSGAIYSPRSAPYTAYDATRFGSAGVAALCFGAVALGGNERFAVTARVMRRHDRGCGEEHQRSTDSSRPKE